MEFGNDTRAICQGMVIGEEGTSALLKSVADCLNALAAMDDTVGTIVAIWGAGPQPTGEAPPSGGGGINQFATNLRQSYLRSFECLAPTVERINFSLQKYRELNAYAHSATEAGRGKEFQAALVQTAGQDFETLVNRRIELLRKLKVRIKVLQRLQDAGIQMIESFDFPEFFLTFMAPIRDVAIASNELYGEVLRGAMASHQALFRVGRLQGEEPEVQSSIADAYSGTRAAAGD
ncbi:MAG TPA: hypothetical protein VKC34_01330 [Blastocatellia bacterium]|nr:hypothetical protein [Blastocatellia bacterium]